MLRQRLVPLQCVKTLGERMRRFVASEAGATAIEYGLILAGVAVFILIAIFAVGDELEDLFTAVQTKLANSYT